MRRVVIEPRPAPVDAPRRPRIKRVFGYTEYAFVGTWEEVIESMPVRAHARRGAIDPISGHAATRRPIPRERGISHDQREYLSSCADRLATRRTVHA